MFFFFKSKLVLVKNSKCKKKNKTPLEDQKLIFGTKGKPKSLKARGKHRIKIQFQSVLVVLGSTVIDLSHVED